MIPSELPKIAQQTKQNNFTPEINGVHLVDLLADGAPAGRYAGASIGQPIELGHDLELHA
ncbi:MAG: hypothetical protein BZY87_08440 [SAR202 cluster bacterium Io17-Chloro-G6]|nr:MAG: hypothetical protein BZY87_08440 [SAR202 cluster bacterium Io17-Chloro-G6]